MIARLIYLSVLLASVLLLGLGMYFQQASHLQTCAPQVLVRYALVFVALFALFVVVVHAGKLVRIAMSACIGIVSLAGVVVAAHQRWPRQIPLDLSQIGIDLQRVLRTLPLSDVVPGFFLGPATCERTRWTMLGVSASEWALIAFLLFIVAAFLAAQRD
jgi:disulfide bond formation protein DsbB